MMEPAQTEHDASDGAPAAAGESPAIGEPGGAAQFVAFLVVAVAVAALFRLAAPNVSDPDSFYHFRHAAVYAEKGLGYARFPWLVYSVVSRFSADLGYGFHVLLIPFTWVRDGIQGIKLAAIFETVAVLALMYWVMRRHRIACAGAWPFVLFFLGPPLTYTFLMARPQTLTMGFSALLLSFMVSGSAWGVLLASFAICFFHLNVFVIVPVVVAGAALVKTLVGSPASLVPRPRSEGRDGGPLKAGLATGQAGRRPWEWRKWVAALAGMALGVALRPNPLGAVKLEYVQFVVHEIVRRKGIPLMFGREWAATTLGDTATFFTWFLLVWVGVMVLFVVAALARSEGGSSEDRTLLWSSLALSVLFFVVMVHSTKRATPLWATFAVIFVAKAFSQLLHGRAAKESKWLETETRLVVTWLVVAALLVMTGEVITQHLIYEQWAGRSSYRLSGAARWLEANSRPGEIVFDVNWDMFPELFFWDTRNRYVSGLDPIFLYAYDQALYWKAHHLERGPATSQTWGSMDREGAKMEDVHSVLKRDFAASYLVLESQRNGELEQYLDGDPRFERAHDDGEVVVYVIK